MRFAVIHCMDNFDNDNQFLVFMGFLLTAYLFYYLVKSKRKTKPQKEGVKPEAELVEETDVLGMKKVVYRNASNYTTLDKLMSWKVFLLMSLIFISVYMIYSNRPNVKGFSLSGSDYTILAPAEVSD